MKKKDAQITNNDIEKADTDESGSDRTESAASGEKGAGRITEFVKKHAVFISFVFALIVAAVTFVLAIALRGDVYDKAALLWAGVFAVEFFYCTRINRRVSSIVFTVISGLLAVAFTVLYALELKGILP